LPAAAEAAFRRAHPGDAAACFLIPKNVAAVA